MYLDSIELNCPSWLKSNLMYVVRGGSHAYSLENEDSDVDILGFCMPPKSLLFPFESGSHIWGFDSPQDFAQYKQDHVVHNDKEHDITIYNITKFFKLAMASNFNVLELLFVASNNILHNTQLGQLVRDNRHLFLSKKCYHTGRGFAHAELSKLKRIGNPDAKRTKLIEKYGYDVKAASNLIRLLYQTVQILETGDLDLSIHKEELKAVKRGEWKIERVYEFFEQQERYLIDLYQTSKLSYSPPISEIRALLRQCIQLHYKEVEFNKEDDALLALRQIRAIVDKTKVY